MNLALRSQLHPIFWDGSGDGRYTTVAARRPAAGRQTWTATAC